MNNLLNRKEKVAIFIYILEKKKVPMSEEEYSAPASPQEFLKTGTYLYCYCPHCHKSFNKKDMAIFLVVNPDGEKGQIKLSPYLNVFKRESTIYLSEGQEVRDFLCPHCEKSLIVSDRKCEICGAKAAKILIAALTKIVPFYICMRVNCHWHGLTKEDENTIHLDESKEW